MGDARGRAPSEAAGREAEHSRDTHRRQDPKNAARGQDHPTGSATEWPLGEVLRASTEFFAKRGGSSPRLEAELLIGGALELTRVELYTHFERPVSGAERELIKSWLRRRSAGEPLHYITGERQFRHLSLKVGPGVLVPRPETELLVQSVIDEVTGARSVVTDLRILDLGTGSGVIALSLAKELPGCRLVAVDSSADALRLAEENVAREQLQSFIELRRGDYFAALAGPEAAVFDVIVANPPYIPAPNIESLAVDVRDWEPRLALDGGSDGLRAYRAIVPAAPDHLKSGGLIAMEIGAEQARSVTDMLREHGFTDVGVARDIAGKDRIVTGRRR